MMVRMLAPFLMLLLFAANAPAETFDVEEIVRRAEDTLRGDTAEMKATMKVVTPRWKRDITFRSWDDRRNDRSLTRILAPKKDKGTGFLRDGQTLWTYLPRVERVTRIPPSMMLQSWMGSDFTNDDLARESSIVDDYDAKAIGKKEVDGQMAYGIEVFPHEEAAVVWSRIELWINAEHYTPVVYHYYDEGEKKDTFELVRTMRFSDVKLVDGRHVPHRWSLIPADKDGHSTEVILEEMKLDRELADSLFTQGNLKRSEAAR